MLAPHEVLQQLGAHFQQTTEKLQQQAPQELPGPVKSFLNKGLESLDVVSREEFDVQMEVLRRTRQKLEALEAQVASLEARIQALEGKTPTADTLP